MKKLFETFLCIVIVAVLAIVGWVYRQEIKTGVKRFVTFLEQTKESSVDEDKTDEDSSPLIVEEEATDIEEDNKNGEKVKE